MASGSPALTNGAHPDGAEAEHTIPAKRFEKPAEILPFEHSLGIRSISAPPRPTTGSKDRKGSFGIGAIPLGFLTVAVVLAASAGVYRYTQSYSRERPATTTAATVQVAPAPAANLVAQTTMPMGSEAAATGTTNSENTSDPTPVLPEAAPPPPPAITDAETRQVSETENPPAPEVPGDSKAAAATVPSTSSVQTVAIESRPPETAAPGSNVRTSVPAAEPKETVPPEPPAEIVAGRAVLHPAMGLAVYRIPKDGGTVPITNSLTYYNRWAVACETRASAKSCFATAYVNANDSTMKVKIGVAAPLSKTGDGTTGKPITDPSGQPRYVLTIEGPPKLDPQAGYSVSANNAFGALPLKTGCTDTGCTASAFVEARDGAIVAPGSDAADDPILITGTADDRAYVWRFHSIGLDAALKRVRQDMQDAFPETSPRARPHAVEK